MGNLKFMSVTKRRIIHPSDRVDHDQLYHSTKQIGIYYVIMSDSRTADVVWNMSYYKNKVTW